MPQRGRTAQSGPAPLPRQPAGANLKSKGDLNHENFKEDRNCRRCSGHRRRLLAPTASAACPYTVGPLGRYIAPAEVRGLYAYGDRVQVWCSDLKDGDDWFFLVDAETDLRIFDRVQLVVNANGTPDDFSDDTVEDAFFGCCSIDD